MTSTATSIDDLRSSKFDDAVHRGADLKRGDLVEFKVRLSASWIFQMSTMVAEFSEMFDESPTLFMDHVKFTDLYHAKNANKIISKLLAGLIPVNGVVSDYVVVVDDTDKFVVHREVVSGLNSSPHPLRIVGVDVFIIDAVRASRGSGRAGKGALAGCHPHHFRATVLSAIISQNGNPSSDIGDVIW